MHCTRLGLSVPSKRVWGHGGSAVLCTLATDTEYTEVQPGEGQGRPLTSPLTQRATGQHLTPPTPARAGQAWHQDPAQPGKPRHGRGKGPAFPLSTCPGNNSHATWPGGLCHVPHPPGGARQPGPLQPPTSLQSGMAQALPAAASWTPGGSAAVSQDSDPA